MRRRDTSKRRGCSPGPLAADTLKPFLGSQICRLFELKRGGGGDAPIEKAVRRISEAHQTYCQIANRNSEYKDSMASKKVFVIDTKLRRHCIEVDDSANITHLNTLLANMSLVPVGFTPKLVYQKRILGNGDSVGSIGYRPEFAITLVCIRASLPVAVVRDDAASRALFDPDTGRAREPQPRSEIQCMGFDEALAQHALTGAGEPEQGTVDVLVGGQSLIDEPLTAPSSSAASASVIFSMGFDEALVRHALAIQGGNEEQAVDLLLSGRLTTPGTASSAAPGPSAAAAANCAIGGGASISCPQGHICLYWTYTQLHVCNLSKSSAFSTTCQRFLQVGDYGYRCDECDLDVCKQCYDVMRTAATAVSDGAIGNETTAPPAAASTVNFTADWLLPSSATSLLPASPALNSYYSSTTANPSDSHDVVMQHGTRVRIEHLQANPEVNGRVGVVRGAFDQQSERWTIEVAADATGPAFRGSFRSANLRVIDTRPTPPQSRTIDFSTEWLDEHGCVCSKAVCYTSQCPKGHALVPFAGADCGDSSQLLMCRVCHSRAKLEDASQWMVCSVTGCCGGYAVCECCLCALQQAPAAVAAGDSFCTLVHCAAAAAVW
jgi:hypothetical protein